MNLPASKVIANIGGTPVYQFDGSNFIGWKSGLNVDADGAPHAYHPDGSPPGLDYLANAGSPGNWWGIVTENNQPDGQPVIQGSNDPAPGFYVSCTSLQDSRYDFRDPRAWVNSEAIPFIVLPGDHKFGGGMGDLATVVHLDTGIYCHAIAADVGPRDKIGEGSIALANALGIRSSPKNGGTSSGIGFLFYPGSGNGRPMTVNEIDAAAEPLFQSAMAAAHITNLKQAPNSDWTSGAAAAPSSAPAPLIVFNDKTASPHGSAFQAFLNQFPGVSLGNNGVLGRAESDATAKVFGFRLSGDPQNTAVTTGPYFLFDPKNRMDYARLFEQFASSILGSSLTPDGFAGQDTSDAAMQIFGHYLIGDPRDGKPPVPPTIPFDPTHFSSYAAQLQEGLSSLPGLILKTDGYAGSDTSTALQKVIGHGLPEAPANG